VAQRPEPWIRRRHAGKRDQATASAVAVLEGAQKGLLLLPGELGEQFHQNG
jgi:hypothetical protein